MITPTSFERRVRRSLIEVAQRVEPGVQVADACISHLELGKLVDPSGTRANGPAPQTRPPFVGLSEALGHVSMFEVERGRPMLSALVVSEDTGRPDQGFGKLATHLGFSFSDPDSLWEAEVAEVIDFWSSADPTRIVDAAVECLYEEIRSLKVIARRSFANGSPRANGTSKVNGTSKASRRAAVERELVDAETAHDGAASWG